MERLSLCSDIGKDKDYFSKLRICEFWFEATGPCPWFYAAPWNLEKWLSMTINKIIHNLIKKLCSVSPPNQNCHLWHYSSTDTGKCLHQNYNRIHTFHQLQKICQQLCSLDMGSSKASKLLDNSYLHILDRDLFVFSNFRFEKNLFKDKLLGTWSDFCRASKTKKWSMVAE